MNDLGSLSQCLVESDTEALERSRRLRRKALGISVVLETALVGAVLLWPLLSPGALRGQFIIETPSPPYHGGSSAGPARSHGKPHQPTTKRPPTGTTIIFQPPTIPPHVHDSADAEDSIPDVGPGNGIDGIQGGTSLGPSIPGGTGSGPTQIEISGPSRPAGPVPISQGVMEASLIHRVQPVYPSVARAMHLSGTVQLRAIIGKNGSVENLEILSGHPLLAQAAVAAVREWRYQPTRLNGEAVEVVTYITVNFVLQ